jgi:hypothetical protein
MFQKAVKHESKLRLAITGPAGSGKTYTALKLAQSISDGKPVAVVDTEHGSASKYADFFEFDVLNLEPPFEVERFLTAISEAEVAGYGVIVLDSLSHVWMGTGGLLDEVDKIAARSKSKNSFTAWKEVTPMYNKLIDGIIRSNIHVIACMRSKTDYVLEEDGDGKKTPKKIGMAAIQRDGFEYEFDIALDMDITNTGVITKTRCTELTNAVFKKPGDDLAEIIKNWLRGAPEPVMSIEEANEVLSPGGKRFGDLTHDQLVQVLRAYTATPEMRRAARAILSENGVSERAAQMQ